MKFFITVGVITAVGAVGVGVGLREKGCHCSSKAKKSMCCYKDMYGEDCPGQCICTRINHGYRLPLQCHNTSYALKGTPLSIVIILGTVSGISFILAVISVVAVYLQYMQTPAVTMVQQPQRPGRPSTQMHPAPTQLVKDETISL